MTRNLAILPLSHATLERLLMGKINMSVPAGTKVIDGMYDWERSRFMVKLEGPAFQPVREGDPIYHVDFECRGRIV